MPEAPQEANQLADEGNDRERCENQIGGADDQRWYPDLNGEPELPSHLNREDPSAAFVTLRLPNVTPRSRLSCAPPMTSNVRLNFENHWFVVFARYLARPPSGHFFFINPPQRRH